MGPHIILLPLPLTALLWLQVGRRHGPGSDATQAYFCDVVCSKLTILLIRNRRFPPLRFLLTKNTEGEQKECEREKKREERLQTQSCLMQSYFTYYSMLKILWEFNFNLFSYKDFTIIIKRHLKLQYTLGTLLTKTSFNCIIKYQLKKIDKATHLT